MRTLLVSLLLFSLLSGTISAQNNFYVLATHNILADVAARVAGDEVEVQSLIPAGADPHAYQMRSRDVATLLDADLLFVNGANFEVGVLGEILKAETSLPTASVSGCVALWHVLTAVEFEPEHDEEDHAVDDTGLDDADPDEDEPADDADYDVDEHPDDEVHEEHEDEEHEDSAAESAVEHCQEVRAELGLPAVPSSALIVANDCGDDGHDDEPEQAGEDLHACDPHVWNDPHNVMLWTVRIRDVLTEYLPGHREEFAANAEAYLVELRALDAEMSEQLSALPAPRLLVTLHENLGNFATRYDFEQESILRNFSSLAQANPAELAKLVDTLRERGVKALFGEEPLADRLLVQLADELGVPALSIYGDSLSEADGPAASYIDLMRENTRRILAAFAAEGGP